MSQAKSETPLKDELNTLIAERGIKLVWLAEKLGYTRQNVSQHLNSRGDVSRKFYERVMNLLGGWERSVYSKYQKEIAEKDEKINFLLNQLVELERKLREPQNG